MKQSVKFIILAVLLVGVLVGAFFAYQNLKGDGEQITKATTALQTQSHDESVNVGAQASDFKVLDINGNDVRLSEQFGKPIVLNFWATWCGYCVEELPAFEEVYKEKDDSVQFMVVNLTDGKRETLKSATAFLKEQAFTFPAYFDTYGEALTAYSAYTIPLTLFINSDGTIADKHLGALDKNTLETKLSELS
ncbi:MAG: TlpA family protein disulfide reductase [Clostridia bacterium]|nr:TlpA family protein disulfide reductase [Clostridia bacterium]